MSKCNIDKKKMLFFAFAMLSFVLQVLHQVAL